MKPSGTIKYQGKWPSPTKEFGSLKFRPSKHRVIQGNVLATYSRVKYYAYFGGLSIFPNDWKECEVLAWTVFCLARF